MTDTNQTATGQSNPQQQEDAGAPNDHQKRLIPRNAWGGEGLGDMEFQGTVADLARHASHDI